MKRIKTVLIFFGLRNPDKKELKETENYKYDRYSLHLSITDHT